MQHVIDAGRAAARRGLDQRVALPRDSYLQAYFGDVTDVLRIGPPLFLVVKDLNLSTASPDVDRVCSVAGCDDGSLVNQVCFRPWSSSALTTMLQGMANAACFLSLGLKSESGKPSATRLHRRSACVSFAPGHAAMLC